MFWILTSICTPSFNAPPIMAMNISKKAWSDFSSDRDNLFNFTASDREL
jgi:hypothetical protein